MELDFARFGRLQSQLLKTEDEALERKRIYVRKVMINAKNAMLVLPKTKKKETHSSLHAVSEGILQITQK